MYAVVSRCKADPTHQKSLFASAKRNPSAPNPKGAHGVKEYYVVDVGPGEWATIVLFESKAAAADWQNKVRAFGRETGIQKVRGMTSAAGPVVHAVTN